MFTIKCIGEKFPQKASFYNVKEEFEDTTMLNEDLNGSSVDAVATCSGAVSVAPAATSAVHGEASQLLDLHHSKSLILGSSQECEKNTAAAAAAAAAVVVQEHLHTDVFLQMNHTDFFRDDIGTHHHNTASFFNDLDHFAHFGPCQSSVTVNGGSGSGGNGSSGGGGGAPMYAPL